MSTDWDEVKRLAADFQRAQLSSTIQRLSERNCVEIVKKLIQLKLIDVIFTSDGKEYLTPQRLLKEIKDELYVHGGRINLVELSQILGVDFSHIEAKATEYAKSEPGIRLILGQLITSDYLDHLAEEVNEKLQEAGQITIGELTKIYDLPGDFLYEIVYERLGVIIRAQPDNNDPGTLFTETYISQNKSKIQGILSGITRPISISNLVNHYQIPEKLLYNVAEELIKSGRLAASLTPGRIDKTIFVPDIYTKSQNEWVTSFYKQNGYLEYDTLTRLGISDPKSYIKKTFKGEPFVFLTSGCVGKMILNQVESVIEETINTGSWTDVMAILPTVFSPSDCQQLIKSAVSSLSKKGGIIHVYGDSIIVSDNVIQDCLAIFNDLMNSRAKEDVEKKPHVFIACSHGSTTSKSSISMTQKEESSSKNKKDERRKKKGGKPGGGTQGRETKIRAVKKKYLPGKANEDSDSENEASTKDSHQNELEFLPVDAIQNYIKDHVPVLQESPEDLIVELANELYRPLNKKYEEVARALYVSTVVASGSSRKKQYAEFQEKLGGLFSHITLSEKSNKLFPDDVSAQLQKHLLKSLCTNLMNCVVNYLAGEHGVNSNTDLNAELSIEQRLKLIEKLPDDFKPILMKMHSSLNAKELDEFWDCADSLQTAGVYDISTRKLDKKKERLIISNYRQSLISQISETSDPALTLHLAVLLIFQTQMRHILNASGRFVPQVISFLQKHVPLDLYQELAMYQEYVIKKLTGAKDDEEAQRAETFLMETLNNIKEHAISFKKASVSEAE